MHLHTEGMLHWRIFFRTCTHRGCFFSCTCTQTGCYVKGSPFALAHRRDATLKDLLLHLHTDGMLHWRIFFRTCTQRGGYVKRIFFCTCTQTGYSGRMCRSDICPKTWKKDGKRAAATFRRHMMKIILQGMAKREAFSCIDFKNPGVRGSVLP